MARAPRPALIVSCAGATPAARLAAEVADELSALGAGERFDGAADELVEVARAGRHVIVVDGCSSSCRAHLLEARGVQPKVVISPDELGAPAPVATLARRALKRVTGLGRREAPSRRRRPTAPAAQTPGRTHSAEDYLLAIESLSAPVADCGALVEDLPAVAAHVAGLLGVSRASTGEMLGRLEESGLVLRGPRREILLTPSGKEAAAQAARRHRAAECFLTGELGYEPAEAYEQARRLRESFTDDFVERLLTRLGRPERCPHGWPIDPALEREERRQLTALSALPEGAAATVVRLAEHDGELLARLDGLGLRPRATLTVIGTAGGRTTVALSGRTVQPDPREVAAVLVRPDAA